MSSFVCWFFLPHLVFLTFCNSRWAISLPHRHLHRLFDNCVSAKVSLIMYYVCNLCIFIVWLYAYVWLPWLRFFRAFSSVARQMPGWRPQRRGTSRTFTNFFFSMHFLCFSIYFFVLFLCDVCFVRFPVLFVCICVLNNCHRVATQLQLNISYHII
jgi:hypothetical protein